MFISFLYAVSNPSVPRRAVPFLFASLSLLRASRSLLPFDLFTASNSSLPPSPSIRSSRVSPLPIQPSASSVLLSQSGRLLPFAFESKPRLSSHRRQFPSPRLSLQPRALFSVSWVWWGMGE
ncbi:hypothetical protein Droror1_Dr00003694 [Drosera rotundifolia]